MGLRRIAYSALLIWLACGGWVLSAEQTKKVSVSGLIYDLKHPDAGRRKEAARLLGQVKSHEAVPALVIATADGDEGVRLEAVRALVEINDSRALPAYIRLTKDSRKEIVEKSIEGIINIYVVEEGGFVRGVKKVVGFINPFSDDYNPLVVEPYMPVSQEAIDAIAALLDSRDDGLRKDASTALGILRARSALPKIESTLTNEDDDGVKVELIRAIYKIGDPVGGKSVIPFISDSSKKVHDEAIFTAGHLRVPEAVAPLKSLYDSGVQERKKILLGLVPVSGSDDLMKKVFESLSYLGDPSCRDIFLSAIEDEDEYYRRYGAEGIGRMGDKSLVTLVAKGYVREQVSSVKLAMSFALFKLGREENLIEIMEDGDQGYYYLLESTPAEIKLLYPYLQTEKDSVKIRILDALGLKGDDSALPEVQKLVQYSNVDVVSAANLAIRRLRGRYPNAL